MKHLFVLILLFESIVSQGQQKQEDSIYSRFLNTTVPLTVFIPASRDTAQPLPVIYSFNYGMVSGAYVAAQLDYFQSANYTLPHSILVNVSANMDRIGFIYASGQLTPTGRQMVECLRREIIPLVEKKYHTASFRSYLGHSFAASYGNYLFQYEPGLFNGYMLLAPEKIGPDQPSFTLTPTLKDWYNKHYTFYYVAVGEHDLARRATYAREVTDKISAIDSTRMYSKYDSIPGGDHSNIVSLSIQRAVEHLYQLYNPYLDAGHEKDVVKELDETIHRVNKVYGMSPQKSPVYYNRFCQLAIANKDILGLKKVLDYFHDGRGKSWYLMQFGSYAGRLNLINLAKVYTEGAMKAIQQKEISTDQGRVNLIECYIQMASLVNDHPSRAWEYFQQALALTKKPLKNGHKPIRVYYEAGKFAIQNQYRVPEGLETLLTYQELSKDVSPDAHGLEYQKTELLIGKGYVLLKDFTNARKYLTQALTKNPDNKEAKEVLMSLP
jgi:hypothetical protein